MELRGLRQIFYVIQFSCLIVRTLAINFVNFENARPGLRRKRVQKDSEALDTTLIFLDFGCLSRLLL